VPQADSGCQAPTARCPALDNDIVMPLQLIARAGSATTALRANYILFSSQLPTSSFTLDLDLPFVQSIFFSIPGISRIVYLISSGKGSLCTALAHLPCPLLHAMAPDARESLLVPPIVKNTSVNASPEHDSLMPPRTSATNRTQSSFAVTDGSHDTPTHTWSPPVRTLPGM
jgi:hypothetical protein